MSDKDDDHLYGDLVPVGADAKMYGDLVPVGGDPALYGELLPGVVHEPVEPLPHNLSVLDSIRGGAQALADGAAMGGGEALTALLQTGAEMALQTVSGYAGMENVHANSGGVWDFGGDVNMTRENVGTTLLRHFDSNKENQAKFTEEYPSLSLALTIAGSIAPSAQLFKAVSAPISAGGVGLGTKDAVLMSSIIEGGAFGLAEDGLEGAVTYAGLAPIMAGTVAGGVLAAKYGAQLAAPRIAHGVDFVTTQAMNKVGDHVLDTKLGRQATKAWDKAGDFTSTWFRTSQDALEELVPGMGKDMAAHDGKVLKMVQDDTHANEGFAALLHGMDKETQTELWMRLSTGNKRKAEKLVKRVAGKEGEKVLAQAYKTIEKYRKMAQEFGYLENTDELHKNYFPRAVKDYEGLAAHDAGRDGGMEGFDIWMHKITKGKGPRNDKHRARLEAKYLRKDIPGGKGGPRKGQPGNMQARTREKVFREDVDFYENPADALSRFIHNMADDLESRRFLGVNNKGESRKDWALKLMRDADEVDFDPERLDDGIEKYLRGKDMVGLSGREMDKVRRILAARFGPGRMGMGKEWAGVRDVGTVASLGHFKSALTQLADIAMAGYQSGGPQMFKALGGILRKKGLTDLNMAGLDRTLMQELSEPGGLPRAVDFVLKATGFKGIDKLGKRVLMDAKIHKVGKMGSNEFQAQYGKTYGNETMKLFSTIRQLKNGKLTPQEAAENPNLAPWLFSVVSDAQPVSPSQMPVRYLEMTNGRLIYQLKSYSIKQLNVLYNDIVSKATKPGQRMEALKNLGRYYAFIGLSNGGVQELKGGIFDGEPFKIEDIPDNSVWALLNLAGFNKYNMGNSKGPGDWLLSNITPPAVGAANNVGQMVDGIGEGEVPKQIGRIPIVGNAASLVDHLGVIDFDNIEPKKE